MAEVQNTKSEEQKRPWTTRTPAISFELGGIAFHPLARFDKKLGRANGTSKAWSELPENPLPTITLPSTVHGQEGQIKYVEEPVGLAWVRSWGNSGPPDKPNRAGRRPHKGARP